MKLLCSPTPEQTTPTSQVSSPEETCLFNSTLAEQLPEAVVEGASWLESWVGEESSGAPTALGTPEAATLTDTLAPGSSHTPDTTARSWEQPAQGPSGATKVVGGLKEGRIIAGVALEHDIGPVKVTTGRTVDPMAAQIGGVLGVSREADTGEQGLTLQGAIDLGWDGVQAITGSAELAGYGAKVGAGGGKVDTVGPIEEKDGKFTVSWNQGAALSVNAGVDGFGGKAETGAGQVLTRTFDTREEAEAFQSQAGSGEMNRGISAAEVLEMQPGESFDYSSEIGIGGEGSALAAAGISAGLEGKTQHSTRVEKVGQTRVKLTTRDAWNVKGKAGAGCFAASVEGWSGKGREVEDQLELDLSKPGVQAVFDAYMLTGQLPDELPAGIERARGEDLKTKSWGTTSSLGTDTYSTDNGTKVGTYYDGDLEGQRVEGHSDQVHKRTLLGGSTTIDSEKHALWAETDGERLIHGQATSAYEGRGAAARVADHLSPHDNLPDTEGRYGMQGGHYRVVHDLDPQTVQVLGEGAASRLAGQAGTPLTAYDPAVGDSMGGWMHGALYDSYANVANIVADEGRDGIEWLVQQTADETTEVENVDTGMGDAESMASIEKQLAILEASDAVDGEAVKQLAWDIASQKIALGADITAPPEFREAFRAQLDDLDGRLGRVKSR